MCERNNFEPVDEGSTFFSYEWGLVKLRVGTKDEIERALVVFSCMKT